MSYWYDCIEVALQDVGIVATPEQIREISDAVEVSHKHYGMAHGHDCIPNPRDREIEQLKSDLVKERKKVVCVECGGRGWITSTFGSSGRSSGGSCWKCHGEGRL